MLKLIKWNEKPVSPRNKRLHISPFRGIILYTLYNIYLISKQHIMCISMLYIIK